MIKLIKEYQEKGHDVCFMITCAGNYVFEHYVVGELMFDVIGDSDDSIYNVVNEYLCKLDEVK